jgi:small subunit ribosomal protein S6
MERKYESCFLLNPEIAEEELEQEAAFIEKCITDAGGEIVKKELWGRKTLAYIIKKQKEAVFYIFYFKAAPSSIATIKSSLIRRANILRYLLIERKNLPQPEKEDVNAGAESE